MNVPSNARVPFWLQVLLTVIVASVIAIIFATQQSMERVHGLEERIQKLESGGKSP